KADVGLSLGSATGQTISLRNDLDRLNSIVASNGSARGRLEVTQNSLDLVNKISLELRDNLIAAKGSGTAAFTAVSNAKAALSDFTTALNTTFNGEHIFSGINTDVQPITDYFSSGAPNKQAVDTAFSTQFGFAQTDAQVNTLTAGDIDTFLGGAFDALFGDPDWGTTWSAASDSNVRSRISTSQLVETSLNANQPAFRDLAKAMTMVADLGVENMSEGAFEAVLDRAVSLISGAVQDVQNSQANLGLVQRQIDDADEFMNIQSNIIQKTLSGLEDIDPYEASNRINLLLNQIEISYAVTSRIQRLSILNHI
ncbi:MAG: flagellar hook-associated family protein, partial [Hyphomicrobiaceae bacterium]